MFQQGEDAMPPSYSVRRRRLTAQLSCRTRTSYTPVKRAPQNIFTLSIHYPLFTNSAHAPILNDLVVRTRQRLAVGVAQTRATTANKKRWRITQNHHASHHTRSAHLRVLCALCVPSPSHVQAPRVSQICAARGRHETQLSTHTKIFLPDLFVIHYYLFTNSVGRPRPTEKKRGAQPIWLRAS